MRAPYLFTAALLAACGGPASGPGTPGDDDTTPDDAAVDPPPPPPPAKRVRFIAMGDAGKGNTTQRRVAVAMRDVCAAKGCDFVMMLGDNIYDKGVDGIDDPQWQTKFEVPYADVNLPFYVVLGNHDNGGNLIVDAPGIGNEFDKGNIEVEYSMVSDKWNMPATHYTFKVGHIAFIALDTNAALWSNTEYGDQRTWLPQAKQEVAGADWVFLAGHHPYRSNGTHGNAGNYDAPELLGIPIPNPLPIQNGEALKTFFDQHVCNLGAHVYFAGHDHSRQWLDEPTACGGTQMIISGAGASWTELKNRGNKSFFEDASKAGFMYVDIDGNTFTGTFYDDSGNVDFTRTFTK